MNLFSLIGQIFKPAAELVDNIHTSEDEKLARKAQMLELQVQFLEYALEYEQDQLKQKAKIITAEANSESWVTRSWRPITMLAFVACTMAYWFGLTPDTLPESAVDNMFTLIQIGVGGYIGGRSAEKSVPAVIRAMKEKEDT